MGFLREAFSEDGQGSASRVMMALHAFAAVAWVTFLVFKNHVLPDMMGVTGFVIAPYTINKAQDIAVAVRGIKPDPKG